MSACTFFGHRDCPDSIMSILRETLARLITEEGVDCFYIGNQGNFDAMVYRVLCELRNIYTHISVTVVLAYMPTEEIANKYGSDTILPEGIEAVPCMVKPNETELARLLNISLDTHDQILAAGKVLLAMGISNVVISMGGDGALLVCGEGLFTAKAPEIQPASTIGAGDSSIAGFLAAATAGKSAADCLKTEVAYGTASCLTAGTLPPAAEDIRKILELVQIA